MSDEFKVWAKENHSLTDWVALKAWKAAWNAALEKAALVAESTICDTHIPTNTKIYGSRAAMAIRALKEE